MRKSVQIKKRTVSGLLAGALLLITVSGMEGMPEQKARAGTADAKPGITKELTGKRGKFIRQFAMSDGSFTAVTYSMPVHYKKNGKWKEIDTTLKKSGKKYYKTKSTALTIKVSKKANKKWSFVVYSG